MADPGVSDIPQLLAYLDSLAEAAREADDEEGHLQEFFLTLRRRIAAIHAHLHPDLHPLEPAPPAIGAASPQDLAAAFNTLTATAESAGLHISLTDYLRNAGHRLTNILEGAPDRRLAPRQPEEGEAQLHTPDETRPVAVTESSSLGLGVHSDHPLEPDQVVRLVVPEPYGATTYECLITQIRPTANGYHVGLEIFSVRI